MSVRLFLPLVPLLSLVLAAAAPAADRGKLAAFLEVTGYDVVIESLQQGAMSGPGMVGDAPETFGAQYSKAAEEVFEPAAMVERALDILAAVMPDELVNAGADFYASELGQRLVAVENAAHMTPGEEKYETGATLLEAMAKDNPERVELLRQLNAAVGSEETSQKAIVEVQVRFLLAAMAAGALPEGMSEEDLRAALSAQVREQAPQTEMFGLISSAFTYREMSDQDLADYLAALKTPQMQQVYEILNAVQYQVMMERYELLGRRLGDLAPQQDL